MHTVDTVIVGAGQAGLALSYHLRLAGREHVLFERGRVAERWRSQRWDSLRFQSPNWSLVLSGAAYDGTDPEGFAHKDEVLDFLLRVAEGIQAPVISGTSVRALRRRGLLDPFEITTERGTWRAQQVVVATGPYQDHHRPALAHRMPGGLVQLSAGEYRNPASLPPGAVLVVGSGASGCQIADELLEAGRRVFLSVGRHRRVPRRYRGRDVFWWRRALGDLDRTTEQTPSVLRSTGPLLTGMHGGYEVDLRCSAARGMTLCGRLVGVDGGMLAFADDLEENLRQGDRSRADFVAAADAFALAAGLDVSPAPEASDAKAAPVASPRQLDVAAAGITSVVWTTGYSFALEWIELPVLDANGAPQHRRGVTAVPGLYFIGLPWLTCAKSSFLFGVGDDAAWIASCIVGRASA